MKNIKKYITAFAAAALLSGFATSCQDDFDAPTMEAPVASLTPNMSILELKQLTWNDATNYIDTIRTVEWYEFVKQNPDYKDKFTAEEIKARKEAPGTHVVISGRVTSSDEASNVFKALYIQDATAGLTMSIDSYNLYLNYRRGQEIVIDATGMYIGKYNGLQQLGMPEWYEQGSVWEASFMSREFFQSHVQLNGLPEIAQIDTLVLNSFSELATDPEGLRKWQGQLVRFNNVSFEEGGKAKFSSYHNNVNQTLKDKDGSNMIVRTSGYSNFWNNVLPSGSGDVVALLGFYGTSGWQLTLIDYQGCMNFGNPTVAPGTEDNPYTVDQVVSIEQEGRSASGWVTGYIVGAVAEDAETTVESNSDVEWEAPTTLANTLVIGQTPDTKDIAHCLVIALPVDSKLRAFGNLRQHPENMGKQIWLRGTFEKYMNTYGITGNTGTSSEFRIEGLDPDAPTEGVSYIDETFTDAELPAAWTQVQVSGNKKWLRKEFSGNGYASMSGYGGTAPFDQWFITPAIDMSKVENKVLTFDNQGNSYGGTTSEMEVYVMTSSDPSKGVNTKLEYTKAVLPASGFSDWVSSGNIDLSAFTGVIYIGFRYYATQCDNYSTLCIDNVKVGKSDGSGGDTPTPPVPTGDYKGDFNSFNNGKAQSSPYGTYSNATGWTAENAIILGGQTAGAADKNPNFGFIGGPETLAPTLNGNTTKVGKLTSPVLTGGIGTLTFSYGFAYNETACQITINILQGGNVVKTHTFKPEAVTKCTAFEYSHAFNVAGDFVIEIVNDCVTNTSTGNKDRISIWNLTWYN